MFSVSTSMVFKTVVLLFSKNKPGVVMVGCASFILGSLIVSAGFKGASFSGKTGLEVVVFGLTVTGFVLFVSDLFLSERSGRFLLGEAV